MKNTFKFFTISDEEKLRVKLTKELTAVRQRALHMVGEVDNQDSIKIKEDMLEIMSYVLTS